MALDMSIPANTEYWPPEANLNLVDVVFVEYFLILVAKLQATHKRAFLPSDGPFGQFDILDLSDRRCFYLFRLSNKEVDYESKSV